MIRIQLSTVMVAVISQLLIPRIDKPGRVAVFEIMVNTPSIAALIRDNKTFRIQSDIQTGAKHGMITLDSCGGVFVSLSCAPPTPDRRNRPPPRG
jgi:twitching motility protein PilT